MALRLKDAVAKAERSGEVKKLRDSGFFLNCAMSVLPPGSDEVGEWILTYYNCGKNKVVEVLVDGSLEFKDAATPVRPTKDELVLSAVKTNENKMLGKAQKEFRKFREPLSQIILSLQVEGEKEKKPLWCANFVTKTLFIITIKIDAVSGTLIGSEKVSLVRPATPEEQGTSPQGPA